MISSVGLVVFVRVNPNNKKCKTVRDSFIADVVLWEITGGEILCLKSLN